MVDTIWKARKTSDEEIKSNDIYNIFPKTVTGKLSMGVFLSGLIIFIIGVVLGSSGTSAASYIAVGGMVIYFTGGLLRAYND